MMSSNKMSKQEAISIIHEGTINLRCDIHPTMIFALMPNTLTEDKSSIQFNIMDVNWNTPNEAKAYSIANSLLGNPYDVTYPNPFEMGSDGELFAAKLKEVSSRRFLFFLKNDLCL